ncbi:MAG TPA: PEGA domain-containing protein, partial [Methanoregulaceae archaeon]|nr:PEGA domain-containing protein [Methanoregulaceae archaeon]
HVVRAFLSGFQPYLTIVNVPPGGTITVDASLLPLSRIGALQVKSNPGGADIYIDGFYSGSTATTVGNLAAGEHFLTLRLAGYQDWLGTVDIPENSVAFIDARLEVASAPTTGDILVSSNPPGAAVFNDEVYVGNTMPDDALDLTGLLPGFHTIRLELQNYQDFTVQVEVESGQIRIVDADMVLATNPSQSGSLLVNSGPQGANVFLDNACIGITPLSVSSVTAGNHTLLIRLAGYNDYSTMFTIAPGEAVQIQAALGPAATPINIGILTLSAAAVAMIFFLRKK